jgi:hypothetical protein
MPLGLVHDRRQGQVVTSVSDGPQPARVSSKETARRAVVRHSEVIMITPRHIIAGGVVLIALAAVLLTGGHGFWVLFGLVWILGPRRYGPRGGGYGYGCGRWERQDPWRDWEGHDVGGRDPVDVDRPGDRDVPTVPDPTRDHHQAFPGSR